MAHLAGALGRPVWLLLPYVPEWRWLLERDDSPWYPSMRLFRQRAARRLAGADRAGRSGAATHLADRRAVMKRPGPPPARRQDVADGRPKIDAGREVKRLLAEGVRHHQRGQMERAAHFYRLVLQAGTAPGGRAAPAGPGRRTTRATTTGALALIGQAIAVDPRPAPYHNSLGVVLLALGRPSEAEAAFARALARDPLYPEALNNLGNALVQQQRLDEAIPAYDRAVEVRAGLRRGLVQPRPGAAPARPRRRRR